MEYKPIDLYAPIESTIKALLINRKIQLDPLEQTLGEDLQKLLATNGDLIGIWNRAVILTLLETGIKANELCSNCLADYDLSDWSILIRVGKAGWPVNPYVS